MNHHQAHHVDKPQQYHRGYLTAQDRVDGHRQHQAILVDKQQYSEKVL